VGPAASSRSTLSEVEQNNTELIIDTPRLDLKVLFVQVLVPSVCDYVQLLMDKIATSLSSIKSLYLLQSREIKFNGHRHCYNILLYLIILVFYHKRRYQTTQLLEIEDLDFQVTTPSSRIMSVSFYMFQPTRVAQYFKSRLNIH
jgi:hypothetical protein